MEGSPGLLEKGQVGVRRLGLLVLHCLALLGKELPGGPEER